MRNRCVIPALLFGSILFISDPSAILAGVVTSTTELEASAEIGGVIAVPEFLDDSGLSSATAVAVQSIAFPPFGEIPVGLAEGISLSQTDQPFPAVGNLSLGAGSDTNWMFEDTPAGRRSGRSNR